MTWATRARPIKLREGHGAGQNVLDLSKAGAGASMRRLGPSPWFDEGASGSVAGLRELPHCHGGRAIWPHRCEDNEIVAGIDQRLRHQPPGRHPRARHQDALWFNWMQLRQ